MSDKQQQISFRIKIFAVVSVCLFVISLVISIIIGSSYAEFAKDYENLSKQQQEIEQRILEQNTAYYEQVLKNGIYGLPNGSAIMYNALKGLYRYRLYVNNSLVTGTNFELRKPECTVVVEEYYVPGAQNHVPYSILKEFSYLNNRGQGGEPLPPEEIFTERRFFLMPYPSSWQVTMTRDNSYPFKTLITIEISNMTQGSEFEFDFGYIDEFKDKFGLNTNTISIRYV
jgi:hypothetical protein